MKQSNVREKQRQFSHSKRVNYLIGGLIGLIFVLSIFTNGTKVSNSNDIQALAPTAIDISAPDQNWASPNGRWDFSWNSSWTTAAKIQNMSAALDLAYTFLVTNWNLPNPLTPTAYEPPIEVSIPEIPGYNGKASHGEIDSKFKLTYYPKFINHDVLNRQPLQVGEHELLHLCQFKAPGSSPAKWVTEGQARMSEDKVNDWLDHADVTDGISGTYLAECNGYLTGSHVNDLTSITYPACMFWNYVCEQFGTDKTDPDYGFDIIRDFWSSAVNPSGTDGITMFNNLMTFRGTGKTFEDVFEDFSIANYAKDFSDASVPTKWEYIDDNAADLSANYFPVSLEFNWVPTLDPTTPISDNAETINRWASKYYEINIDPGVEVITIQFNQTTANTLFYALLALDGNDLEYSYTLESVNFQRAIINEGYDKICVIVVGLENSVVDPAGFKYLIEGATPELSIESPKNSPENFQARAGTHDLPEKFPSVVYVSQRKTIPVHGLSAENFQAFVGGIEAPVLVAVDAWGRYFLEIQAPNQSADGLYDLRIDLLNSDGTTIITTNIVGDCVKYGASYIDNMLVIDRSGSMDDHNKTQAAKSVAKMYVNSYLSNDQMGVVRYDDTSQIIHNLMKLTPTNRNTAINAIQTLIFPGGMTSIGAGLLNAQNELYSKGIANYSKEIIVLSDGMENTNPKIPTILPLLLANGTTVHCIAIGDDPEGNEKLQDLAGETGGAYYFCFDPASGDVANDLAEIYRSIVNNIRNLERFYQARGAVAASSIKSFLIPVKSDADYLEFVVHYNASKNPTGITLKNVAGVPQSPVQAYTLNGMGHRIYQINSPTAGTWNITIDPDNTGSELRYFVEGTCRSSINMRVMAPPMGQVSSAWGNVTLIGDPEPIIVTLTDSKPIIRANITVEVTPPDFKNTSVKIQIPLYDDGTHNDGLPEDGVFGNLFTATAQAGSYSFIINATGISNDYGSFIRIRTGAFQITDTRGGGFLDSDKDGLPDNWELRYGLNRYSATGDNGASGDPDKDGLPNGGTFPNTEFYRGTNPLNSDTDDGGEADGYEVSNGRNPLDPKDDNIDEFPLVQMKPGNKSVQFIFPSGINYTTLNIYRSSSPSTGYGTPLSITYPSSCNLSGLTNYNTYYYRFQGLNATGRTGLSREYKVIPKLNVVAPEGCLIINDGNTTTSTNLVELTIYQVSSDLEDTEALTATYMRFGNTVKALYSAGWVAYSNETTWLLPYSAGAKVVYAQLRDSQTVPEVSPVFSAGIYNEGTEIVGPETTVTILLIIIDLIVITIVYYKIKRADHKILSSLY